MHGPGGMRWRTCHCLKKSCACNALPKPQTCSGKSSPSECYVLRIQIPRADEVDSLHEKLPGSARHNLLAACKARHLVCSAPRIAFAPNLACKLNLLPPVHDDREQATTGALFRHKRVGLTCSTSLLCQPARQQRMAVHGLEIA